MGLELFSPDEERSAVVTAILTPDGVDARELVLELRDRFGITVAGAHGELGARMFRIGTSATTTCSTSRPRSRQWSCCSSRAGRTSSAGPLSAGRSRRTARPSVSDRDGSPGSRPRADRRLGARAPAPRFDVVEDATTATSASIIGDFDAIVVRSGTTLDAALIERAERLKVIGRAGVGVDNVDVDAATRRGIVVANAPEATVVSAAEHTIALLLAVARNVPQAHAALTRGVWERPALRRDRARRGRRSASSGSGGSAGRSRGARWRSGCASSRTTRSSRSIASASSASGAGGRRRTCTARPTSSRSTSR